MTLMPVPVSQTQWNQAVYDEFTAVEAAAATNSGDIATVKGQITTLQGQVATNTTDITTLKTDDTNTQAAVTALQTRVNGLATVATTGSYTDLTNKPTIPAAYTDEQARDALGAALVAGTNVTITPNDAADTITIAASGGMADLSAYGVVIPSGADPTGAADSTTALQNALTSAANSGAECYIPAGTYKVSAALTASADSVRVRGAGAGKTVLSFTVSNVNLLTVGAGNGNQVRPTGYLRDLTVRGPSAAPASGKAAVVVNGLNQFLVDTVQADNADIGFDLINNCYGTGFRNVRAGFGGSVNVGVNLRTGGQSGSDLTFLNPWVAGRIAAFHCAGGGGGYHVIGGQVGAGQGTAAATDTSGSVILGKDYLTGTTGESSIDLRGVSFEGTNFAWCLRAFDQCVVRLDGCSFNPASSAAPAIGLFKNTNHKNTRVMSTGSIVSGFWSAASMVSIAGSFGNISWFEHGTYTASQQPTIAGTASYLDSFAGQAGILSTAQVIGYKGISFGGLWLRNNAGALEKSTDGTTWTAVSGGTGSSQTTITATTQTGTAYTLALTDAGQVVELNNAAANTVTVPADATVNFPVGSVVEVFQLGAGQTTIAAAAGVNLRSPAGLKLSAQYASVSLRKRAANEWAVLGSTTV